MVEMARGFGTLPEAELDGRCQNYNPPSLSLNVLELSYQMRCKRGLGSRVWIDGWRNGFSGNLNQPQLRLSKQQFGMQLQRLRFCAAEVGEAPLRRTASVGRFRR